ncbi:MAG: hypothetical protein M1839_004299 [Geoglossum umbratile]|nr:MAG: hypothetical protein M1839_004299 [Geoglossum umbratile]
MRDIYRRSNETFICLSTASADNYLFWVPRDPRPASDHQIVTQNTLVAQEEPRAVTMLKCTFEELLLGKGAALSSTVSELARSGSQSGPEPRNPANLVCGDGALLESIRAFMECPWWRRSWVHQEFILSPRPYFLSGSTSVSWKELHPLLEFVCSGLDAFFDSMIAFAIFKAEDEDERARLEVVREQELYDRGKEVEVKHWGKAAESKSQAIDESNAKLTNSVAAMASREAAANPLNFPLRLTLNDKMERIEDKRKISSRDISGWILEAKGKTSKRKGRSPVTPRDPLINDIIRWDRMATPPKGGRYSRERVSPGLKPLTPRRKQPQSGYIRLRKEWEQKRKRIAALQIHLRDFDSSAAFSMMRDKAQIQQTSDLKELLQHSRNCEASGPRDRVYAFLGLAHRGYGIEPDYTMQNGIVRVLTDTASRIIEYDMSLKVLEHVYQGRNEVGHSLPTWVPDWTSKESNEGFKRYDLVWGPGQEARPFDASRGLRTKAEFRKDGSNELAVDMKVKGVFVDILDEHEEPAESFPSLKSVLMPYCGRTLRVISSNSMGCRSQLYWKIYLVICTAFLARPWYVSLMVHFRR